MENMNMNMNVKMFETRDEAVRACRQRNHAYRIAGNRSALVVVVEGPADDWAVMDVREAIEMEVAYSWYV